METLLGILADIAEVFVDFWVNKIVEKFSRKKKK